MKLTWLWKDNTSGVNGCPALYRADGGYVIQGRALDAETRAQLRQLGDDEDAVFVPANVLDRLREAT
ncbi:MAG: lipid A biosynthesis lauroyl acyltransferase [Micromonosporaceae bacterium]